MFYQEISGFHSLKKLQCCTAQKLLQNVILDLKFRISDIFALTMFNLMYKRF